MKEFLSRHSIEFTERNIAAEPAALAELEAMGYHTTPVTLVGKEVVIGFDQAKLEALFDHRRKGDD